MKFAQMYLVVILVLQLGYITCGPNISNTKAVVDTLFTDYRKYVLPVHDQFLSVLVNVSLHMKFIQAFDEVAEKFSFAGALEIGWNDVNLVWDPASYDGVYQLVLPYDQVWIPRLILSTAATSRLAIDQAWNTVRIESTGEVWWLPANLFESTCAVDVRNYPFDTQICETSFFSLGYRYYEVALNRGSDKVDISLLQPNALWDVVDSGVRVEVISTGESEITFSIHLRRKSSYVIVNVVLPILFLSLLNICVFMLVPESGERIGYCITALLAIAVYMTIIAGMLPQSSDPVPLVSYKLMVDMMISALIVLVTILTMKMHNTDDDVPVPRFVVKLYIIFTCSCCRRNNVRPEENGQDQTDSTSFRHVVTTGLGKSIKRGTVHAMTKDDDSDLNDKQPTWKDVAKATDMVALIFFFSLSFGSFLVFVLMTKFG